MCLYNIYRKCDKLSAREFDVLYLILKSKQQYTKTVSETQLVYLISIKYFFFDIKTSWCWMHMHFKFDVWIQGARWCEVCSIYGSGVHNVLVQGAQVKVFFELFYTILVIQNFYRLYCIGDDWSVHCFWGVVMLVLFLYFFVVD